VADALGREPASFGGDDGLGNDHASRYVDEKGKATGVGSPRSAQCSAAAA
jgi:hypothetical protein